MRMQILKIVVVLLVAGSGDARPQKTDNVISAGQAKTNDAEWRDVQARNKTHDTIRDDSRYTGTSGRNRKSYITRFRDNVDSLREHNVIGSRVSGFAPTTRSSFNARRSKIDDIWTTSEFKRSSGLSKTNVLSEITENGVKSSNKPNGSLFGGLSNHSRFILASNKSSDLRIDYPGKVSSENLGRPKSDATLNQNFKLTDARTRYSSEEGNFLNRASGLTRMSNNISIAKNRHKLGLTSVKSESLSNKRIIGDNTMRWKTGQVSNIPSSHTARIKVSTDPWESAVSTHSIRKDHKSIRKNTDSLVTLHENLKPAFVTDSFRHVADERDDLNNSGELARPILISNSKSKVGYDASHRHTITSNRNFVKLRYPFSTSNRNASNVALNLKLKDDSNVRLREPMKNHLTRIATKRPALNDRTTFNLTRNHDSSHAQNLSSQIERVDGTSTIQYNLKNWPNETFQTIEDLYNYNKYTSSLEKNSNRYSGFHDADQMPMILSSDDGYNHPDPIINASVKKIINWLKVPIIVPNNTQFLDDSNAIHKPVESVFESIYENLEPNRPLSVSSHDDNHYETVILQDPLQSQNLDEINYHEKYPTSEIHPQYVTNYENLSPTLTSSSSWSGAASLKNKTVYNPTTYVTQNTVVQILNDGLKEPNVTQVPQSNVVSADQAVSFSDQDSNIDKQELNTQPSSDNCPTITINTYTRVNNTIQSKEGCTDLNIIVNSHILNTNVFKPSGKPTELDQQTSLATDSYGDESDKYAGEADDLSHQDSINSYVTAPIGTYDSLETPGQNDYDSQKDPTSILDGNNPVSSELSTVEVFQNTQISILNANVPLADSVADGPVGAAVDGPAIGDAAAENLDSAPVLMSVPSSSNSATGQANSGLGTLQLPALPSRPLSSLSNAGGTSSLGGAGGSGSPSYDDDDDDYDLSPGGLLQSVASVFTYFSLLNPLGYSFFSLAAAPFAAMAAGVLGVAAVVFPWAIPSVLDFGRAADKVTIKFRPNVEDFVKQAVHKYNGLNEWKSRRKKRRR